MLTEDKLERIIAVLESRIDAVNTFYLKKVGEQINEIGKLSPASIHKLIQIRNAGTSIDEINRALQKATQKNLSDINELYHQALQETYTDNALTALARGMSLEPLAQNQQMQTILEAMNRVTVEKLKNFSNTTNVSRVYQELISDAVQAALSGVGDYNSAIRSKWEQAALDGLRVTYESGVTRRLDTAIRMNVIDGVKHIQQEAQHIIGEKIGADGVEITAHPNSAKDHEPCQGRQFTKAEYEKMQSGAPFYDIDEKLYEGFNRPIGEWNCTHFAFDIIIGVSKRKYSDKQLEGWRKVNNEGCEIDGEHYTNYEASRLMRKMETKIRQQKDLANAAKASGDDLLRRKAQKNITNLTAKYKDVSDMSGLETKFERTFVSGFKDVKLQQSGNSAIITSDELKARLGTSDTRLGTLPNALSASTVQDKLQRYLLNSNHPIGREKARVLNSVLGYHYENWNILSDKIYQAVQNAPVSDAIATRYGTKYKVPVTIVGEKGKSMVLNTVWQIDTGNSIPRFITSTFNKKTIKEV